MDNDESEATRQAKENALRSLDAVLQLSNAGIIDEIEDVCRPLTGILDNRFQRAETENRALQEELGNATSEVETLREDLRRVQSERDTFEESLKKRDGDSGKQDDGIERRVTRSRTRGERGAAGGELKVGEQHLKDALALKLLRAQDEEQKKKIRELEADVDKARQECKDEVEKVKEGWRDDIKKLGESIDETSQLNAKMEPTLNQLNTKIIIITKEKAQDRQKYETRIKNLEENIRKLQDEVAAAMEANQNEYGRSAAKELVLEAIKKKAQEDSVQFHEERDGFRKERSNFHEEKRALMKGFDTLLTERDSLRQERDALQKIVDYSKFGTGQLRMSESVSSGQGTQSKQPNKLGSNANSKRTAAGDIGLPPAKKRKAGESDLAEFRMVERGTRAKNARAARGDAEISGVELTGPSTSAPQTSSMLKASENLMPTLENALQGFPSASQRLLPMEGNQYDLFNLSDSSDDPLCMPAKTPELRRAGRDASSASPASTVAGRKRPTPSSPAQKDSPSKDADPKAVDIVSLPSDGDTPAKMNAASPGHARALVISRLQLKVEGGVKHVDLFPPDDSLFQAIDGALQKIIDNGEAAEKALKWMDGKHMSRGYCLNGALKCRRRAEFNDGQMRACRSCKLSDRPCIIQFHDGELYLLPRLGVHNGNWKRVQVWMGEDSCTGYKNKGASKK